MKPIINRKASYNYHLQERLEAGIVLTGNEIKQIRAGKVVLADAYVLIKEGEAFLVNAHIIPYEKGTYPVQDPRSDRKLLLKKNEIDNLVGKLAGSNLTIVPTRLYFRRNYAKIEIALAVGKKRYDKRETIRKREQQREAQATLREAKLNAQKDAP